MTWQKVVISDLCDITSSKRIYVADYQADGIPFYRGKEISEKYKGNLDVSTELFISESKYLEIKEKFGVPEQGDLLLTSVGTLGNPYVVQQGEIFYFKDGNLTWFRNFKKLDSKFLFYWLVSPQGKAELKKCTIGSSQSAFTIVLLKEMQVELPPLDTQRKIAAVLSAYDDLIENNTRRIQILEEMAQAIYRQWFLEFQYPGHESVPLVDSGTELGEIPEGWEVMSLSEACNSIDDGDWIETKDQGGSDYRLLQISNIGFGQFRETGRFRYVTQETFDRLNCNEVVPGDILVARMPTPIGRAWLVTEMPWRMITAVDVAILRVNPELISNYYCVEHLNSPTVLHMSEVLATGTTRPRITRRNLSKIPIAIPPTALLKQFDEFVSNTYELSHSLMKKNANLRATRDLLLPRLVGGAVDVTDVQIKE